MPVFDSARRQGLLDHGFHVGTGMNTVRTPAKEPEWAPGADAVLRVSTDAVIGSVGVIPMPNVLCIHRLRVAPTPSKDNISKR